MRKNTTESKLVYLGKWKKKIINALYQAGVLLPENASWEKITNAIMIFRQRRHLGSINFDDLIDGENLISDPRNYVHKNTPNSYDPSAKYPININLMSNMNMINPDSPEFDINLAMYFWLLSDGTFMNIEDWIYTKEGMNSKELEKIVNEELSKKMKKNLYKDSNTFKDPEYWGNLENWTKETGHDVPGEPPHKVISYTGSWMDIRLIGDGYELNQAIDRNSTKSFIYSVYLKADRDATVSFFPKTANTNLLSIEPGYQGIKVSTKWERHSVKITVTYKPPHMDGPPNVSIPLNPVIQSPENIKLYLAMPMLIEGDTEEPYNDGVNARQDPLLRSTILNIFNKGYIPNMFDLFNKIAPYPLEYPGIVESPDVKEYIEQFKSKKASEIANWGNNLTRSFVDNIKTRVPKIPGYNSDKSLYFKRTFEPKEDRYIPNPFMGYVPYSRWGEYGPEITTVYIDMRWREAVNESGKYNLTKWKKDSRLDDPEVSDKDFLFRMILDEPSDTKHSDLPPALTVEPTYGKYYNNSYGKGFAPNYQAILPEFIKFISSNDPMREIVTTKRMGVHQFGLLGHWGEWHNNYGEGVEKIGNKELMEKYIEEYKKYINIKDDHRYYYNLNHSSYGMMRRPFSVAKENDMGVFNDMLGDKPSTDEWLDWINNGGTYDQTPSEENMVVAYPEVLTHGINGGELTSGIPMEDLLGKDLETTIETIKNSHVRMIGQKIPDKSVNEEAYWKILEHVGYRIHIKDMTIKSYLDDGYTYYGKTPGNFYLITLTIENRGNAFFSGFFPNNNHIKYDTHIKKKDFIDNPSLYDPSSSGSPATKIGIINLPPGRSTKISIPIILKDIGGFPGDGVSSGRFLFYIREKWSNKFITFDNNEFDKFLVVGIPERLQ